jgi:hypothetical protein
LLILILHDSRNLGPFGSNKKFLYTIHRSALLRRDRMQIYLPCDVRQGVAQ